MSNLLKAKDELLEAVQAPARKKTPSNNSLYAAIVAADIIFGVLDIGSGLTVYWVTGIWFYGLLVFLAGIVPLLLNQKLYTRAFASEPQKKIAIGGALLSVFSILGIGLLAGIANVNGVNGTSGAELVVVAVIVILAFAHAILLTWYFYSDEGIQADQTVEQVIANAIRDARKVEAGDTVLGIVSKAVQRRHQVEDTHGSPAALAELLHMMGLDKNQNGVPDFLEQRSYSQTATPVAPSHTQTRPSAPIQNKSSNIQMDEFLDVMGMTKGQAKAHWVGKEYRDFANEVAPNFDYISGNNMRKLYGELMNGQRANP